MKAFRIVSIYDTETTNIELDGDWRAYPVLFQVNTITCSIADYELGKTDNISFIRTPEKMIDYIRFLVDLGRSGKFIPIMCGYNAMFDLQSIIFKLSDMYVLEVCAQTTSNIYYIDLFDPNDSGKDKKPDPVLRIWDTFHLEMGGVAAMGKTAGVPKLSGDWDYSRVRTPETPLTQEEVGYAARDVQVIPAYLRYLVESNPWLTPDMLGTKVLTKTSLVRRMAQNEIGELKIKRARGKGAYTLLSSFIATCDKDIPATYESYALRRACFRGGFTFTAARWASVVVRNVASLDVTSMHHTFINGRKVPINLRECDPETLQVMCKQVIDTPLDYVLDRYDKPFPCAFCARIKFTNIRLRRGTPFEEEGIGLALQSKFGYVYRVAGATPAAWESEKATKLRGWCDKAVNAVFAFGKLYSADIAVMHLTEVELYAMSLVYEWDGMRALFGEATLSFSNPPLYIVLQSHLLFKRKQDMKFIVNKYHGDPYTYDVPDTIPESIAESLYDGTTSTGFIKSYYQSTVKGMFNGIYGTQAQDMWKPSYIICNGRITVNSASIASPETFDAMRPKRPKVLYTYGTRIVGGSRLHLVIAIILLYRALGGRVHVTGGDTDSLKVACDYDVTDEDLTRALEPIARASKEGIDRASARARELFPAHASDLKDVGSFDVEDCGADDDGHGFKRYDYHMEAWNKARVSIDQLGHAHVTCAGLSRPDGIYNFENAVEDLCAGADPRDVLPCVLGYEVFIYPELSHSLQRTHPAPNARVHATVTDWQGVTSEVDTTEAVALYPVGRWLGSLGSNGNAANVKYLHDTYGRYVDTRTRFVGVTDLHMEGTNMVGTPFIKYEDIEED